MGYARQKAGNKQANSSVFAAHLSVSRHAAYFLLIIMIN